MKFLLITLVLLFAFAFAFAAPAGAQSLRTQLESAYAKWQGAIVTKNLASWTEATAAPRRAMTRNIIVSQRQPFPKALFSLPMSPPPIYHLRFLKAEEENGTAAAAYFGKVDFGIGSAAPGGEIPENILILRFMKEDGGWKFDRTRFINLAPTPDLREKIAGGDRAILENPLFDPAGAVPPVPAPVPVPDYVAHLEVIAAGYEATVRINEHHESIVADDAATDLVIGGLAEGKNAIHIETRPLEGAPEAGRQFEVSVYITRAGEKKPPVRIYHYAPEKAAAVPAEHKATVYANAVTLGD